MNNSLIEPFLSGFILALGLILPLGAQNTYVLTQGTSGLPYARTLPVVITAAISDTLLILIAVLGISMVLLSYTWIKTVLVMVGISFMAYIGWASWFSDSQGSLSVNNDPSIRKKILYTLSISIFNPYAILDTVAVIGTSSLTYSGLSKTLFVTACIAVSWLWFFFLSSVGRVLKNFAVVGRLQGKISAVIIWFNAILLFYKFFLENVTV